MNNALMFSKASDEWSTPKEFYAALDAEFDFMLDAAASAENSKLRGPRYENYYLGLDHPDLNRRDALSCDWYRILDFRSPAVWLNPPYSQCREFIAKAALEASKGCTVVCLVPSRTDTRWWHEHVWDRERHRTRPGVEVRFVKSRLKFGIAGQSIRTSLRNGPGSQPNNSAPFPSVVIVFRPVPLCPA